MRLENVMANARFASPRRRCGPATAQRFGLRLHALRRGPWTSTVSVERGGAARCRASPDIRGGQRWR